MDPDPDPENEKTNRPWHCSLDKNSTSTNNAVPMPSCKFHRHSKSSRCPVHSPHLLNAPYNKNNTQSNTKENLNLNQQISNSNPVNQNCWPIIGFVNGIQAQTYCPCPPLANDQRQFQNCAHIAQHKQNPNDCQSAGANDKNSEEILKSESDPRNYRALTLGNKLRVLLCSDEGATKAAAAMSVLAGSMQDPENIPGLAHFCEHMTFLGTEKYPEENSIQNYLTSNGGDCNAYTMRDSTVYFFDVATSALEGALDRFAQLFISPLFLESASEREVQAVDSEFKKHVPLDSDRRAMVDMSLVKKGHPYGKFDCGNFQSLSVYPRENSISIMEELKSFQKTNYSSNLMCLVVLGKESLEELERMVRGKFENIKNSDKSPPEWPEPPYGPDEIMTRIDILPVTDIHSLLLIFPVGDYIEHFKTGMTSYLTFCLMHEGQGSLLAHLKSQNWTTNGITVGYEIPGKGFAFFAIEIELTLKGLGDLDLVVQCFFQYLEMLRKEGVQRWLWEEQRIMNEMDFRFMEKEHPVTYVEALAALMPFIPTKDIMVAKYELLYDYKTELISEVINLIVPTNMRMIVTTKQNAGVVDSEEKWYGAKYKYSKIPPDLIEKWQNCGLNAELKLPLPNQFIPTCLDLKQGAFQESGIVPEIIKENELSRVWFLQDTEFNLPEASIMLFIISPALSESAGNYNRAELLATLVIELMNDLTTDAMNAGIKYVNLSAATSGFCITATGYSDNCHKIFEPILKNLVDFNPNQVKARYKDILEEYTRSLENKKDDEPYYKAFDYCTDILRCTNWSDQQLLEDLKKEKEYELTDIAKLRDQVFSEIKMEWFFHGNYTKQEALQLYNQCSKHVHEICPKPLAPSKVFEIRQGSREAILTPGWINIYKAEHHTHWNSAILFLLQCGMGGIHESLILELIQTALDQPAFDTLRTQEQLGYVVFTDVRKARGTLGLRIIVQGEKDPVYLDERVEKFVETFSETMKKMESKRFEELREAMLVTKLEKPKTLRDRGALIFEEIMRATYDFNRQEVEAMELQCITLEEVQRFYKEWIAPQAAKRKKLLIQVTSVIETDYENDKTPANKDKPSKNLPGASAEAPKLVSPPLQPQSAAQAQQKAPRTNSPYSPTIGFTSGSDTDEGNGKDIALVIPSSFENSPHNSNSPAAASSLTWMTRPKEGAETGTDDDAFHPSHNIPDGENEADLDSTLHTWDNSSDREVDDNVVHVHPNKSKIAHSTDSAHSSTSSASQTAPKRPKKKVLKKTKSKRKKLHWRPSKVVDYRPILPPSNTMLALRHKQKRRTGIHSNRRRFFARNEPTEAGTSTSASGGTDPGQSSTPEPTELTQTTTSGSGSGSSYGSLSSCVTDSGSSEIDEWIEKAVTKALAIAKMHPSFAEHVSSDSDSTVIDSSAMSWVEDIIQAATAEFLKEHPSSTKLFSAMEQCIKRKILGEVSKSIEMPSSSNPENTSAPETTGTDTGTSGTNDTSAGPSAGTSTGTDTIASSNPDPSTTMDSHAESDPSAQTPTKTGAQDPAQMSGNTGTPNTTSTPRHSSTPKDEVNAPKPSGEPHSPGNHKIPGRIQKPKNVKSFYPTPPKSTAQATNSVAPNLKNSNHTSKPKSKPIHPHPAKEKSKIPSKGTPSGSGWAGAGNANGAQIGRTKSVVINIKRSPGTGALPAIAPSNTSPRDLDDGGSILQNIAKSLTPIQSPELRLKQNTAKEGNQQNDKGKAKAEKPKPIKEGSTISRNQPPSQAPTNSVSKRAGAAPPAKSPKPMPVSAATSQTNFPHTGTRENGQNPDSIDKATGNNGSKLPATAPGNSASAGVSDSSHSVTYSLSGSKATPELNNSKKSVDLYTINSSTEPDANFDSFLQNIAKSLTLLSNHSARSGNSNSKPSPQLASGTAAAAAPTKTTATGGQAAKLENQDPVENNAIPSRHINVIQDITEWKKTLEYYPLPLPSASFAALINTAGSGSKDQNPCNNGNIDIGLDCNVQGQSSNARSTAMGCQHHQSHTHCLCHSYSHCHHHHQQQQQPEHHHHCHGHENQNQNQSQSQCNNNNRATATIIIGGGNANDPANNVQTIEWEVCPTTIGTACPHHHGHCQ